MAPVTDAQLRRVWYEIGKCECPHVSLARRVTLHNVLKSASVIQSMHLIDALITKDHDATARILRDVGFFDAIASESRKP